MKIFIKNKKSFALILAVFVLLAFSVSGMTAISLLSRKAANTFGIDSMKAFYAAEAARNYYLERISFANNFTATECSVDNFNKSLGGTPFLISYTARTARSATITFTGGNSNLNSSYGITRLVEENSQTIDSERVTSPTIVDQLRRFNLMVWDCFNTSTPGACTTMRIGREPLNCMGCGGGSGVPQGQNFLANAYFNKSLSLVGQFYVNCCSAIYPSKSYVAWGRVGKNNNLYINGGVDLSNIYSSPVTNYGVFGTLFRRGTVIDTQGALHGSPTTIDCVANPTNGECMNWPTTAPTINRAYYDGLITRAAGSAIGTTLIDTSSSVRSLGGRNIFFNGDVTINTTDASPLQGPGNIIATGSITINNGAFIRDNIGLIAGGNITIGTDTRIGGAGAGAAGYDTANQLIIGSGVLLYSRGTITFGRDSRVKAFCISANVIFYLCRGGTSCAGSCCPATLLLPDTCDTGSYPYPHSQLQGLAYADVLPYTANISHATFGFVYGNLLLGSIPSDAGQACSFPACQCWMPAGLGLGSLFDTFPAASSRGATISELPLKIRGIYNLLITTPQ